MLKVKKYFLKTFGCQSNRADSDRIRYLLESMRHYPAKGEADADLIIYNTCSVRDSAENRIFGLNKKLRQLKEKNQNLKIVLTGCMMHHQKETLGKRLPYIDHFLPIKNLASLPSLLGEKMEINPEEYLSIPPERETSFRAYIPISYGCNNFCTYCVVPFARGREYSRPVEEILQEARKAIEAGAKEVWLLGQNVNSYGLKEKTAWEGKTGTGSKPAIQKGRMTFANLLREVNRIPGDFWIRFTSAHPKDFSDDLTEAMAECEKFPKYINLPAQSGDNAVLSRMNRNYTREHFIRLIGKIRSHIPEMAVSTDTIVGFSGETEKEFKNSLSLYEELEFDMAFIAEYSPRPGTAADISLKDDIPHSIKEQRRKNLTEILKKTASEKNKILVGKTLRVLADEQKSGRLFGKSPQNKVVEILGSNENKTKIKLGDFYKVKITEIGPWKLKGELV